MLPAVVDAIGRGVPLLVDGGVRRGTDVLKVFACSFFSTSVP